MKAIEWAQHVGDLVKGYVDKAAQALESRIKALEDRKPEAGPAGKDGDNGKDGKDAAPVTSAQVLDAIKASPELLGDALKAYFTENPVPAGKDGDNGKDAEPVAIEVIDKAVADHLAKHPPAAGKDGQNGDNGKDGKDGERGSDGKSITVDDMIPVLQSKQAEWALDFERRAGDVLQRAIDRVPIPKDGQNGKDGANGLGFDDVEQIDEDSAYGVRFKRGDKLVEFKWAKPTIADAYRGIFKEGNDYPKGDCVTFGGSLFVAMRDTKSKPESDDSWRLAVKRGRDGKDWSPSK